MLKWSWKAIWRVRGLEKGGNERRTSGSSLSRFQMGFIPFDEYSVTEWEEVWILHE